MYTSKIVIRIAPESLDFRAQAHFTGTATRFADLAGNTGFLGFVNAVVLPENKGVLFENGRLATLFGGIGVLRPGSEEPVWVSEKGSDPIYSPSGHILYTLGVSLNAVPFDFEDFEVNGLPEHVLADVRVENGGAIQAAISSRTGTLVYAPANGPLGTQLVWLDPKNATHDPSPVNEHWRVFSAPRISPEGDQIAVVINTAGKEDIYVVNTASGEITQKTFTGDTWAPVWDPSGIGLAFASGSQGNFTIRWISLEDGSPRTLIQSENPIFPETWHPEQGIVCRENAKTIDLFLLSKQGDEWTRDPKWRLTSADSNHTPSFSPNGKFLAYASRRGATNNIYVRPFDLSTPAIQIDVGSTPVWHPDGDRIFYMTLDESELRVASLTLDPLARETPKKLMDFRDFWGLTSRAAYDVNPRDARLLALNMKVDEPLTRIRVHVGWSELLGR